MGKIFYARIAEARILSLSSHLLVRADTIMSLIIHTGNAWKETDQQRPNTMNSLRFRLITIFIINSKLKVQKNAESQPDP